MAKGKATKGTESVAFLQSAGSMRRGVSVVQKSGLDDRLATFPPTTKQVGSDPRLQIATRT